MRLESCCRTVVDCPHSTPTYLAEATGFYAIDTNCMDEAWNQTGLRYLSEESYEKRISRYEPQPGDLVLSREGSIGRSVILNKESVCLGQRVMVLGFFDNGLLNRYCQAVLTSPYAWSLYMAANVGTGVKHINVSMIKDILIPLPPRDEQVRVIEMVDNLRPHIDQYGTLEDARERLDAELPDRLRKSILQLAVQGKLVEQDADDEPASVLLNRIRAERAKLIKAGKLKAPKGGESIIYRSSDGGYYEKRGKGEPLPIEVPFDIPDTWEWVRLKTLGEIVGGGTPKTHNATLWASSEDGVPWITPADMKNVHGRRVSHGERYLSEKGLAGSSAQLMPAGTIVMSSRAPIGYLAIAECPIATNQGFKSVVPTQVKTNAWIMLALDALMDDIKRRASGTTFKEISGSEFGETLVPIPPLAEQARIIERSERSITTIG